jgi:hypothetical protein
MPFGRRSVLRLASLLALAPAARAVTIDPGLVQVVLGPDSARQQDALRALKSQFAHVRAAVEIPPPSGPRPVAYVALGPAALQSAAPQKLNAPLVSIFSSRQSFLRTTAAAPPDIRATAIYAEPSPAQQMRLIAALYRRTVVVGVLLSEQSGSMGPLLLQAAAESRLELVVEFADPSAPLSRNLLRLASASVVLIVPDSSLYTPVSLRELLEATYRRRQPVVGFSEGMVAAGTLASAYSAIDDTVQQLRTMVSAVAEGRLPPPQFPRYWRVAVNDSVARSLDIIVDDEVRRLGDRP